MGLFRSVLRPSWAILVASCRVLRQLGSILGVSWPILGLSWGHLGSILRLSESPGPSKTLIFLRFLKVFVIGLSSLQIRLSHPILRYRVFLLGSLGVILGPFWTPFGPSWCPLGPSWGHPGSSWCLLGATLAPSWLILGPAWATMGTPGRP